MSPSAKAYASPVWLAGESAPAPLLPTRFLRLVVHLHCRRGGKAETMGTCRIRSLISFLGAIALAALVGAAIAGEPSADAPGGQTKVSGRTKVGRTKVGRTKVGRTKVGEQRCQEPLLPANRSLYTILARDHCNKGS